MKVKVIEQSASERTIEVVVDAKKVESAFESAFKRNLNQFALPGFRKGKVPKAMAERYITDGALVRDVVNDLVPKAFQQAIKEQKLEPISEPDWDLVQNERGKDLVFKASFTVAPVLSINGYDGLEIEQEKEEITDQHVQDTLQRMAEQHAEFVTLEEDRGIVVGDFAVVDYTSFQNGEEIENGSMTNYMMEMKPENYIDGFVSNLQGAKGGEERTFDISFPEDYNNEELAGETVTFKFKIHDIKVKRVPEIDDDFAQSHSENETIEELRKNIRERLEGQILKRAEGEAVTSIVKQLLEQVAEETIPAQLRQHHAQRTIRMRMYELAERGLSLEQVLQARGLSQDAWIQEMMAAGLFEARLEVLYRSIAQAENVTVDDKELDELIAQEAKNTKMKPKQLRKQMEKNGSISMLEYTLLQEKLHGLLLEKANLKFVPPGSKKESDSKKKTAPKAKKDQQKEPSEKADKSESKATKKTQKATKSKDSGSKKSEDKATTETAGESKAKAPAKKAAKKAKKAAKKKS
ncbi:MAG: trigger factor [Vulcanimicrobiota bacterium]